MKSKCINFKDRVIENMYDYDSIDIDYTSYSIDKPIEMIREELYNLINESVKDYMKYIRLNIHILEELDEYEAMDLKNIAAKATITEESTNRGYMSIPPYFKEHIDLTIATQRDLGNFVNKFEKLQIVIYDKNNKWKLVN